MFYIFNTVKDGDARARSIFDRHYSRYFYKDGRRPKLFVGPGEKLVLMTPTCDALFVWRKFISGDNQQGINCAVFRNEGAARSSDLIAEAERMALTRWPDTERFYTYVKSNAVQSTNPGYCFQCAGWVNVGTTKRNKLVILAHELWR